MQHMLDITWLGALIPWRKNEKQESIWIELWLKPIFTPDNFKNLDKI